MRIFSINEDKSNWGFLYKYGIDATHNWKLPLINCTVCNRPRGIVGVIYPTVDLSSLPTVGLYMGHKPVNIEELDDLRQPIIPMLPPNSYLPSGTQFGNLEGNAWGKFGDFVWLAPWILIMQRQSYQKLVSEEVQMPVVGMTPQIKFRSKNHPDLVELQVEPLARLVPESFIPSESTECPGCGFHSRELNRFIVDSSTIPSHVDLFRTRDHPTYILATERLKDVVEKFNMTDILFEEVDVQ